MKKTFNPNQLNKINWKLQVAASILDVLHTATTDEIGIERDTLPILACKAKETLEEVSKEINI